MPQIILNDKTVLFEYGQTILEVARAQEVDIPTLCHLPQVEAGGTCRICVVKVSGSDQLLPACATPAEEGMVIKTDSPEVRSARRTILEMLVASGRHNCFLWDLPDTSASERPHKTDGRPWHQIKCPADGDCRLQDLVLAYGVNVKDLTFEEMDWPLDDAQPMIVRDYSRCIQCGKCIQACNHIQVHQAIPIPYGRREDRPQGWFPLVDNDKCVHCGECVQVCPVGALFEKKAFGLAYFSETRKIRTTCPYCGVGCQQLLHVKNDKIVKVTGVEEAEPNQGRLCVKGRFGYDFIYSEERLKTPLIRENGTFREASWDEALDLVAGKFQKIIAFYGPDALAGVSCARSINEDSYQMQKLFRAVIGTNNIDHCARACHAPTVAGLAASFGSGAMTNSFAEFPRAKMFLVIGSNMTEAHPVASTFVKNAVVNGARLILVDPRRHRLADFAELYVPLRVGSDIAFLNSLMYVLIDQGLGDNQFVADCTEGFEALRELVQGYPPEKAAEICGISADTIRDVALRLASVKPVMLCYTLGITEHTCGRNNVVSTANLQMLLGNMGVECGGVNPLRGQNNVQGACDMGALPNVLTGYHPVTDPAARAKFEAAWGVEKLPDRIGLMTPHILEGLVDKRIRGFYIFGENLANVEPDIHKVEHELASAEFLVCQDIFPTETTRFAHVILPAAAWSENDGTFTNSERRVNRVRTASPPPGQAMPNWWIFKQIAKRMGHNWSSDSAKEIWDNEVSELAPPFRGIKYDRLEGDGLQWPCPEEDHPGTCVLHQEGQFTCGRGRFHAVGWAPPAEVPDDEYPLVLSTGRRLYHYHTRTQTGRCEGLNDLLGEETADISPADAATLNVTDGEMIYVRSRRGEVKVKARVTHEVPQGMVWMAFHFREACANWITNPAFDPITLTAEYKACAVRIEKCV